ncbi:MAG: transposase, partial [Pseudomonadota bacterium]
MKPRSRGPEQDDLLRPRLTDMIDMRHELVKLEALIDWEFFEAEWAGFFPSHMRRQATSPRLVAGLLYLQHAYRLSDEAVVARWVENPYYQHFCGETFFQHRLGTAAMFEDVDTELQQRLDILIQELEDRIIRAIASDDHLSEMADVLR